MKMGGGGRRGAHPRDCTTNPFPRPYRTRWALKGESKSLRDRPGYRPVPDLMGEGPPKVLGDGGRWA